MSDSSTTVDPKAKALLAKHATMRRERSNVDSTFQEIKDLVRPDTADFNQGKTNPGDARRRIFDGTAPWSLDQLAAGVHSYVTSPVDRWFGLILADTPWQVIPYDGQLWLEAVSDIIYSQYSNPFSSFAPAVHELYLDLCGFGTGVMYQFLNEENRTLTFRTFPLSTCYIAEDANGQVNRLHRENKWSIAQCKEEFGDLPPKMAKMPDEDMVCVVHGVYYRDNRVPGLYAPTNKKWASCWVCEGTMEVISESGYDEFPYHSPRWTKMAGDVYGRGPALSVLPEIRMVNAMSKTVLVAAQKIVDPALQVPDDGFLLPIKTMPGGLNFKRPGTDDITPMPTAQRVDIGVDQIEQRRDAIRRGFYVDWLVRPTKKERQTAQEISDDRNQMLSMMGPIIGRIQTELLGPMLRLSFHTLMRRNMLPPMPASISGSKLDIVYLSPAARAQSTVRGQGIQSWIAQMIPLAQAFPGVMDSVNEDMIAPELADLNDVPRRVMNSPDQTAAKKQARAQAQQIQQATESLPAAAKSLKDVADAKQAGLTIPSLGL